MSPIVPDTTHGRMWLMLKHLNDNLIRRYQHTTICILFKRLGIIGIISLALPKRGRWDTPLFYSQERLFQNWWREMKAIAIIMSFLWKTNPKRSHCHLIAVHRMRTPYIYFINTISVCAINLENRPLYYRCGHCEFRILFKQGKRHENWTTRNLFVIQIMKWELPKL